MRGGNDFTSVPTNIYNILHNWFLVDCWSEWLYIISLNKPKHIKLNQFRCLFYEGKKRVYLFPLTDQLPWNGPFLRRYQPKLSTIQFQISFSIIVVLYRRDIFYLKIVSILNCTLKKDTKSISNWPLYRVLLKISVFPTLPRVFKAHSETIQFVKIQPYSQSLFF